MATGGNVRYQFRYAHEPGLIDYEGPISMTTASQGTVTALKGVSSITCTGSGAFTLTLNRKGTYLRSFHAVHYASTGALLSITPADVPATCNTDVQAGSVKFVMRLASNCLPTDPKATDVIWVKFTVSNSIAGAR